MTLVEEMKGAGLVPDEEAFIAVMVACARVYHVDCAETWVDGNA